MALRRMTLEEYKIRMKAHQLRQIDKLSFAVDEAFIHRAVMASKQGKPVIKKKSQVIDVDKLEGEVMGKPVKLKSYDRLKQIADNLAEYRNSRPQGE